MVSHRLSDSCFPVQCRVQIPENNFLSNLNGSVTKSKNSKYCIEIKEFYQGNTFI